MEQPLLEEEDMTFKIPAWNQLRRNYDARWEEEKEKTSQWRSGKQEIYVLTESTYSKYYERAFRDLFADTGYQATVGPVERLGTGNKKSKRLFITLPDCFGR